MPSFDSTVIISPVRRKYLRDYRSMFLLAASLLTVSLGNFPLQSGQFIQDCKLTYRTFGTMNAAKTDVILFPTWFNGTTEDLEKYMGPVNLADPAKFFVIAVDALANGVSSSPSNSTAQHNKLFPRITIRDMIESEHKLLVEKLGITHVYAVMGISMGGMQTFQWMTAYPSFMDRAVTIVGTPRMGEKDMLLWSASMRGYQLGRPAAATDGKSPAPKQSMLSQLIAMAPAAEAFLSPQARQQFDQIFQGGNQPGHTPPASDGAPKTPVALPVNKNPENVLHQFEAMVVHDISRDFGGSWDKTASAIKARVLVINSIQDQAVSPDFPQQFAAQIKAQKFMMTGPCGHNAYKPDCEESSISPVIRTFLDAP